MQPLVISVLRSGSTWAIMSTNSLQFLSRRYILPKFMPFFSSNFAIQTKSVWPTVFGNCLAVTYEIAYVRPNIVAQHLQSYVALCSCSSPQNQDVGTINPLHDDVRYQNNRHAIVQCRCIYRSLPFLFWFRFGQTWHPSKLRCWLPILSSSHVSEKHIKLDSRYSFRYLMLVCRSILFFTRAI